MKEYIDLTNKGTIVDLNDENETAETEKSNPTGPSLSYFDFVLNENSAEHSPKESFWKSRNRKEETGNDVNYSKSHHEEIKLPVHGGTRQCYYLI